MVLNEPMAFTAVGYLAGIHAPGKIGFGKFLKASVHASLCLADGSKIIRKNVPNAEIGSTFSCTHIEPLRKNNKKDIKAVERSIAMINRFFIEPALGLGYPIKSFPALKRIKKYMKPGDEELMKADLDFVGVQNYTRDLVKFSLRRPVIWAYPIPPNKRNVPYTEMKWEVYPESMYHMIKLFGSYPQVKKILITENGASFPDTLEKGVVNDETRKKYIQDNLEQVLRAKKEGYNVQGYFIWSFMDNFEWAEGFRTRFGIVHVDFKTQVRTIKNSGKWYAVFLGEK